VTGEVWPSFDVRIDMLREAVALMRELFTGRTVDHRGEFFTVDDARLWTVPDEPVPVWMSGFGEKATRVAADIADGYVTTSPDQEMRSLFSELSGGKPSSAGLKVAWAPTSDEGVDHAHRLWANAGLPGELAQVLPSPHHFEQASQLVTRESTAESVVAGNDVEEHVQAVQEYADAGFDELYVSNIGPHWREMIAFYGEHVVPKVS
ncbi:MAG TPA: TIGR03557 family F420-dependent LLM class oxidoreductase, partial [Nocardioides sp.]|nr:TIGR03557 family F420-dependent LLM class oxidoreductase [Nocardioides sp.]